MNNKKIIAELIARLKDCIDPIERDDLEDRIIILVEQDEYMETLTRPAECVSKIDEKEVKEEVTRLEREKKRYDKETNYKSESKLDSVEEELTRRDMMNEALASNDDYAYKKSRKITGAKNKSKKYI